MLHVSQEIRWNQKASCNDSTIYIPSLLPSPGSASTMPLEVHKPARRSAYNIVIKLGAVSDISCCCNDEPADWKRTEIQMKRAILMVQRYLAERDRCHLMKIYCCLFVEILSGHIVGCSHIPCNGGRIGGYEWCILLLSQHCNGT